ncbi:MAG: hypothetical protein AB7V42_06060 [Thermoleophilia bacterium]
MSATPDPGVRRRESREEIVARVQAEQERLHPSPVYSARSRRRLRIYLVAIFPVAVVLAWLTGLLFGWNALEIFGFAVGLVMALAYIGYVLLTERDDGRIQKEMRRLAQESASGPRRG